MSHENIGDKFWHNGDEVTVTSEPYPHCRVWVQDVITDQGKELTIITHRQKDTNTRLQQENYRESQEQF